MTAGQRALGDALAGFSAWSWLGYEARALRVEHLVGPVVSSLQGERSEALTRFAFGVGLPAGAVVFAPTAEQKDRVRRALRKIAAERASP